jgi:hypothetical protein
VTFWLVAQRSKRLRYREPPMTSFKASLNIHQGYRKYTFHKEVAGSIALTNKVKAALGDVRSPHCTDTLHGVQQVCRLCGLVVRVLGYRSGGPGPIPGTTKKNVVGLERGPLSLVSTTEELLDRKVAAPV